MHTFNMAMLGSFHQGCTSHGVFELHVCSTVQFLAKFLLVTSIGCQPGTHVSQRSVSSSSTLTKQQQTLCDTSAGMQAESGLQSTP